MSGGAEANRSGLAWEAWVSTVAKRQAFELLHHSLRASHRVPVAERRVIWTHAPYKTIFHNEKTPRKTSTEYVVECGAEQARIECKWQSGSGSVDEKFPFVYLNAVLTMTEPTIVLALGGEYFERGKGAEVREWLRSVCVKPPPWLSDQVRETLKHRKLLVHTTNTFERWFRESFPR